MLTDILQWIKTDLKVDHFQLIFKSHCVKQPQNFQPQGQEL